MRRQGAQAALVLLALTVAAAALVAHPRPAAAKKAPPTAASRLGAAWQAFERGDYARARALAQQAAAQKGLLNRDYALYVLGQGAFWTGDFAAAHAAFTELAAVKGSRFADEARWRVADCLWEQGKLAEAGAAYKKLVGKAGGDDGVARYRVGEAALAAGNRAAATDAWRDLALALPAHPLADRALERLAELGAPPLSARERIARAARLTGGRDWTQALDELAWVGDGESTEVLRLRDFWLGNTLFKMRRQYGRAGELLLAVHDKIGGDLAAYALFHGARGLSRDDRDDEAIKWYAEVVRKYPKSEWADEAQFLSGWLEYNRGEFRACIAPLEQLTRRYPGSKWAEDALWYQGYARYLLGEYEQALPLLEKLGRRGGALSGGKGRYWHARTLDKLGRADEATAELRELPRDYPLTWYAILARARLAERGVTVGPFGERPGDPDKAPALGAVDAKVAADPVIARADELIAAGLAVEAGEELKRAEKALIKKYGAPRALPTLFDRYARARNFNRPWRLAEAYGRAAFQLPPKGRALPWWKHAYPLAFREHVDKYEALGKNPPFYMYAIMLKESGFDPHVVSYADAMGLMQMIPPTSERVAPILGMVYTDDLLFDPEMNVKLAAWYVGNLVQKFRGQIPLAAGSYNGGPRAMTKWLDRYPDRPIDEFVELVSFSQSREYMKKVTGIYARYLLIYADTDYQQPLAMDSNYLKNDLNY